MSLAEEPIRKGNNRIKALKSQADTANAQEYDAKALLLQTHLDSLQAHDELLDAMGITPE